MESPHEVAARLCSFAKSVARGKGAGKAPAAKWPWPGDENHHVTRSPKRKWQWKLFEDIWKLENVNFLLDMWIFGLLLQVGKWVKWYNEPDFLLTHSSGEGGFWGIGIDPTCRGWGNSRWDMHTNVVFWLQGIALYFICSHGMMGWGDWDGMEGLGTLIYSQITSFEMRWSR